MTVFDRLERPLAIIAIDGPEAPRVGAKVHIDDLECTSLGWRENRRSRRSWEVGMND